MVAPAAQHPGAGADPRMHPVRHQQRGQQQPGRADPQRGRRRPRAVGDIAHTGVRQHADRLAPLVGDHLLDADPAAQRRGEDAARAGPDDEVDVRERARQAFLQGGQRAGHPGRAEHPARPEHQAHPGAGPPGCQVRTHERRPTRLRHQTPGVRPAGRSASSPDGTASRRALPPRPRLNRPRSARLRSRPRTIRRARQLPERPGHGVRAPPATARLCPRRGGGAADGQHPGGIGAEIEYRRHQAGAADAIHHAVVHLREQRPAAALDALQEPRLPQRPVPISR